MLTSRKTTNNKKFAGLIWFYARFVDMLKIAHIFVGPMRNSVI